MTDYRASFDATVRFSNGGDLTARGFRVDLPASDTDADGIAALFVASLGLLMTESVMLANVQVFAEPHKGTRGGPADRPTADGGMGETAAAGRLVELSHVIRAGMVTLPGLPGPQITPYLTRDASRASYAHGTEFAIDWLTMIGNTGTYLDAPYHRSPDSQFPDSRRPDDFHRTGVRPPFARNYQVRGAAALPFGRELSTLPWFLIVVAGLFETAFAILLKQSHNFTRLWPTIGFVACALISFGLLNLALNRLEVGPAYAVWTGIGAAGTAIAGIVVLGESNSPLKLASVGLIVVGVIGLNLSGVTP